MIKRSESQVENFLRASTATYSNFQNEPLAIVVGLEGVQDSGQLGGLELDCNNRLDEG